eukprot:1178743-Prorocentrum_minimum.AAC.1
MAKFVFRGLCGGEMLLAAKPVFCGGEMLLAANPLFRGGVMLLAAKPVFRGGVMLLFSLVSDSVVLFIILSSCSLSDICSRTIARSVLSLVFLVSSNVSLKYAARRHCTRAPGSGAPYEEKHSAFGRSSRTSTGVLTHRLLRKGCRGEKRLPKQEKAV